MWMPCVCISLRVTATTLCDLPSFLSTFSATSYAYTHKHGTDTMDALGGYACKVYLALSVDWPFSITFDETSCGASVALTCGLSD